MQVENEETIEAQSARTEALLEGIQQRFSFVRVICFDSCICQSPWVTGSSTTHRRLNGAAPRISSQSAFLISHFRCACSSAVLGEACRRALPFLFIRPLVPRLRAGACRAIRYPKPTLASAPATTMRFH
ncbi:hypothetical protein D7S89_19415 [Trinickia fusca]|uniref:Uncharacterized protein n=1 Tax=Trinickia fusca TaxID=2419777 RepID=A0A494XAP2_9BURK|nr:hypothetical protein D7S89_19415 [Trinickia fusca]